RRLARQPERPLPGVPGRAFNHPGARWFPGRHHRQPLDHQRPARPEPPEPRRADPERQRRERHDRQPAARAPRLDPPPGRPDGRLQRDARRQRAEPAPDGRHARPAGRSPERHLRHSAWLHRAQPRPHRRLRRRLRPRHRRRPAATSCWRSEASADAVEIAARARRPAGNRSFTVATLTRRPAAVLAIAAVLTAVLALGFVTYKPLGLQGLQTDASVDLLADPGSPAFADQVLFANSFGADPLVIEVEAQPGKDLLTGDHFIGLAALEGDIAGRPGVKKVYGPGTVGNELALEGTKRGL